MEIFLLAFHGFFFFFAIVCFFLFCISTNLLNKHFFLWMREIFLCDMIANPKRWINIWSVSIRAEKANTFWEHFFFLDAAAAINSNLFLLFFHFTAMKQILNGIQRISEHKKKNKWFFLFAILICIMMFLYHCLGSSISILESSVTSFPYIQHQHTTTVSRCNEVTGIWAPCMCSLELCIPWYPCALKYCKGKNDSPLSNQVNSSYRCGIKTCRKCNNFTYYVRQKQQCLWDEWPTKKHQHKHNKSTRNQQRTSSKSVINRYLQKIFDFNLL